MARNKLYLHIAHNTVFGWVVQ